MIDTDISKELFIHEHHVRLSERIDNIKQQIKKAIEKKDDVKIVGLGNIYELLMREFNKL